MFASIGTGGPIIAVLAVLSLISLTVIGMKIAQLWNVKSGAKVRDAALEAWAAGRRDEAQGAVARGRAPADRVIARGMQLLGRAAPRAAVEADVMRLGNEEVAAMNSHIRLLELIAMVSPLLGLLGTVLGMIQSFQELELAEGAANASVLAGGIWQALLTTAAGLLVAIPAAAGAVLLAARAERGALAIESAVARLYVIEDHKAPAA